MIFSPPPFISSWTGEDAAPATRGSYSVTVTPFTETGAIDVPALAFLDWQPQTGVIIHRPVGGLNVTGEGIIAMGALVCGQ